MDDVNILIFTLSVGCDTIKRQFPRPQVLLQDISVHGIEDKRGHKE